MNVFITSASRKVALVQAFQEALALEGSGKVLAGDVSSYAAALYHADQGLLLPRSDAPEFMETIIQICQAHQVELLVPTRDEELEIFAMAKERLFNEAGTTVMVADPYVVRLAQDKMSFYAFCMENGFLCPACIPAPETSKRPFPWFARPRRGKGGRGAMRIAHEEDRHYALRHLDEPLFQECIDAPEFTIDLFANFQGQVLSAVPRKRIKVFGGESFISQTVNDQHLIDAAVALARAMHLVGHNTLQCFRTESAILWIEVNPRYGGAANLGIRAGAHTPRFAVRLVKGLPVASTLGKFSPDLVMMRYTEDLFMTVDAMRRYTGHKNPSL